ncbi:hypothetical protein [Acidithiobacillus ferridurans]|uniref:hypothetical protein n=1 Tax=Acidithiobacillus ferridurans TaxID=1232575 RepID=UPI001C06864D|nr:hypothetical protein [Acidithiobacillus ferridurans]MBU2734097.1 hypothetical protein [Acidithiobacillus ferridurans]
MQPRKQESSARFGYLDKSANWQLAHERRNLPREMLDPTTGFAAEWHRRLLDRRKQKEKERAQQKNKPGNREILNEDRRSNSDLGAGMDKIGDFAFGVLVYSCCWIIFRKRKTVDFFVR